MKVLLIGGTGVISTEITRLLSAQGHEVTLLNRGTRAADFPSARHIALDISDEEAAQEALKGERFDVAADFICFEPGQARRDIRLFSGKTGQFIFISSASAYQKPLSDAVITESTPLHNPYWRYSQNKAKCEDILMEEYRKNGFPVTIVRPSHTFSERSLPVPVHGSKGAWAVVERMRAGKRVLVPGDGESLWAVMPSVGFAPAFCGLCGNPHAIGQAVQITGEEILTWNQIMRSIASACGGQYLPCYVPSDLLAGAKSYDYTGALLGDKANTVLFDNSKLHHLVPHLPPYPRFDQAVRRSVAWLDAHPEYRPSDPEFDAFCDRVCGIMDEAAKKIREM